MSNLRSGVFNYSIYSGADMSGMLDDYLRVNETAINLRAQRQQLLASNIANADTPNYKARDIDFNKSLQSALARNGSSVTGLSKTNPAHLGANASVDGAGSADGATI